MSAQAPVIAVDFDLATGTFYLTATSYGLCAPAGARLFRGPPFPDVQFQGHATEERAKEHAARLAAYIAERWVRKQPSKAEMRRQQA